MAEQEADLTVLPERPPAAEGQGITQAPVAEMAALGKLDSRTLNMEHKKLRDYAGWAQAAVASVVPIAGGLLWVGHTNSQVSEQQQRISAVEDKQAKDHDKVTRLDEKVDAIKSTTDQTSTDVKQLLQNQADVKADLERYNKRH